MSNRTLIELNHDYCPQNEDCLIWAEQMQGYMHSGDKRHLPDGVTFIEMRHHSELSIIQSLESQLSSALELNKRFNRAFDRWACGSEFFNDPERIAARMSELVDGKIELVKDRNAALEAQRKAEQERDAENAIAVWAKSEFDSLARKLVQVEGIEERVRSERDLSERRLKTSEECRDIQHKKIQRLGSEVERLTNELLTERAAHRQVVEEINRKLFASQEQVKRLTKTLELLLSPVQHLPGCLFLERRSLPCQCGFNDRINAAMKEAREVLAALAPAQSDTGGKE